MNDWLHHRSNVVRESYLDLIWQAQVRTSAPPLAAGTGNGNSCMCRGIHDVADRRISALSVICGTGFLHRFRIRWLVAGDIGSSSGFPLPVIDTMFVVFCVASGLAFPFRTAVATWFLGAARKLPSRSLRLGFQQAPKSASSSGRANAPPL